MTSRGHPPAPGIMRHGPPPRSGAPVGHHLLDHHLPPERAEKNLGTEMDRLVDENRMLAASQLAMRQDLSATQEEIDKVRAHIRSIQTESDIQIRVLLDKTRKLESDAKAGVNLKEDLHLAHREARDLVTERQELIVRVEKATQELEKAWTVVGNLPNLLSELDKMRVEHQQLRDTFEHKKRINIEQIEQMREMEKDLIGLTREVDRLRAEVANAEKRAQAPYGGGAYLSPNPSNPTSVPSNGSYYDTYGRQHVQIGIPPVEQTVPYSNATAGPAPAGGAPVAVMPAVWGGPYNASMAGS